VTLIMAMVVIALAVMRLRHLALVPLILNKVDRLTTGVVLAAMLRPVLRMSGRHS
jgi:chromate transport protein ChrA